MANSKNKQVMGYDEGPKTTMTKKYRASLTSRLIGLVGKETHAKHAVVIGVLYLKPNIPGEPISPEKLKNVVLERLFTMPRFYSRIYFKRSGAYWEPIPLDQLDMSYHARIVFENETPTVEQVEDFIGGMADREWAMDLTKPLWRMIIVPRMADGRTALISQISHTIGDGISQIEVLFNLMDKEDLKLLDLSRPPKKRGRKRIGLLTASSIFLGGVFNGLFAVLGTPDPKSSLKLDDYRKPTEQKAVSFAERIPLEKCKEIKNKVEGATLNDVLLAILTMSIKGYYEAKNEKTKQLTASFPINLRKRTEDAFDQYGNPHNSFAYGFMKLHMKYKDPKDLMQKIIKTTTRVKLSPSPFIQKKLVNLLLHILPAKKVNDTAEQLSAKATAMLSNVAGPQAPAKMAGFEIDELGFQLFSGLGLYLGILTYAGSVSCSVNCDASLADPKDITVHWKPSFEALYAAVVGA